MMVSAERSHWTGYAECNGTAIANESTLPVERGVVPDAWKRGRRQEHRGVAKSVIRTQFAGQFFCTLEFRELTHESAKLGRFRYR